MSEIKIELAQEESAGQRPLALDVRMVTKYYESGGESFAVLNNLSYSIAAGSMYAIMGPSGAGKSTFLNIVGGLDRFEEGEVVVADQGLKNMTQKDLALYRNEHVGFIFQSHNLLKEFTALENVAMPLLVRRMIKKEALARAREVFKEVGLDHREQHRPTQLSGGENQRVAVARALVTDPTLVLADEPTGNLDQENSKKLIDLLLRLQEQKQKTIILVTHDRDQAEMAKHIDYMVDGEILERKVN